MSSAGGGPAINAAVNPPQLAITGHGFLPGSGVLIRVIDSDDMVTYFEYTADIDGDLIAVLPPSLPRGTLQISATDRRPGAADETGLEWTDTATVVW